uniref:Bm8472 n=1 Tax=Brugia malayi TaxID=6279 RepID=A0A1I9G8Z0_BRUMA|nr:Bm8472 [Brugia malayi]
MCGMPNAGKSKFLTRCSNADAKVPVWIDDKPKIACMTSWLWLVYSLSGGYSSAGRTSVLHAEGQRFDPSVCRSVWLFVSRMSPTDPKIEKRKWDRPGPTLAVNHGLRPESQEEVEFVVSYAKEALFIAAIYFAVQAYSSYQQMYWL